MHVAIAWDNKPLLLLTTALLPNRTTESFLMEAGPPYDEAKDSNGVTQRQYCPHLFPEWSCPPPMCQS